MAKQQLRDANYRVIGEIETDSQGKQTIRDANYRIKGTYEPKNNQTRDANYRIVGTGNLLTSLL